MTNSAAIAFDRTAPAPSQGPGVPLSVVVCQGGQGRLRQLAACLAALRQCPEITELIVVDMGSAPFGEEIARRWADIYLYVQNDGAFERARTLNIGTAIARHDLVLWTDNDLMITSRFLSRAIAEMHGRELDFFLPFTSIKYLSEPDSQQIIEGTRSPLDCRPEGVLTGLRGVAGGAGGAGFVKRSFVVTHGGMSEVFLGWGGEDDAWWYKAKLLGRTASTRSHDQFLHHLFHTNSGDFAKKRDSNPHYARNVAILRETCSLRDKRAFLRRFPPPPSISWRWIGKRIGLIGPDAGPELAAPALADRLGKLSSVPVSLGDALGTQPADALVICGMAAAAPVLDDDERAALWPRTIVVHTGGELDDNAVRLLGRAAAVACVRDSDAIRLRATGLRPWKPAADVAITVLQPLSLILGGATPSAAIAPRVRSSEPRISRTAEASSPLPVWMYWEGPCPDWIKRCHETAFAHGRDVRLLSPDGFDKLRDTDRDIDLSRLHVAHRADFVRAFLLARYGGLWIDSDCLVMKPLTPILEMLGPYDFIAHKERSGLVSNGFIGSRPGGTIAAAYYGKVCSVLRSRSRLGWTSLGSQPLSEILRTTKTPWFELHCERVQPVGWHNPGAFFATGARTDHDRVFDARAICYMLSNVQIRKYQAAEPAKDLLAGDTFFQYALGRALDTTSEAAAVETLGMAQPATSVFTRILAENGGGRLPACPPGEGGPESVSGPGSTLEHTAEIRQRLPLLVQDLGVGTVLDAGCGDFNWLRHVTLSIDHYTGVDVVPGLIAHNRNIHAAPGRGFLCLDIAGQTMPRADLVLCRDCLVLHSYEDIGRTLRNLHNSGSEYLLATTFENHTANQDAPTGNWRALNFRLAPFFFPEPLRIINEKCTEGDGGYSDKSLALWRIADLPLALCTEGVPQARVKTERSPEPELAVIVPIALAQGQQGRLRNLESCLRALNSQDLERSQYSIIVVEQDVAPRLESLVAPVADRHLFAFNPGPFNRGWAFNVGAAVAPASARSLCLIDADMLPPRDFLSRGLRALQSRCSALRPFSQVVYLDARSTDQAVYDRMKLAVQDFLRKRYDGLSCPDSKGGCMFLDRQLFQEIGGFDERFRGFGYEDTEFWDRLSRRTTIEHLPGTLLHMHHPRAVDRNCEAVNARLYRQVATAQLPVWTGPMGNPDRYEHERNGGSACSENVAVFARLGDEYVRTSCESVSGPGSSLLQTLEVRRRLPALMREINARSMLDAGCGDFHWLRHVEPAVEEYIGADFLASLIEQNRKKFARDGRQFLALDITRDPLPPTDIILCRDCLVLYPYADIHRALENFRNSGAAYLLMTTFEDRDVNADTAMGIWRPLNFRLAPFGLPEPLVVINENCSENGGRYRDKSLALWRLKT